MYDFKLQTAWRICYVTLFFPQNFLSIEIERSPSSNHMTPESDGDGGWSIQTTNMSACWDYTNEAPGEGKLLLDNEVRQRLVYSAHLHTCLLSSFVSVNHFKITAGHL